MSAPRVRLELALLACGRFISLVNPGSSGTNVGHELDGVLSRCGERGVIAKTLLGRCNSSWRMSIPSSSIGLCVNPRVDQLIKEGDPAAVQNDERPRGQERNYDRDHRSAERAPRR
jgi:hypothetical protein